jgi:hypothetical protein
VQVGELGKTPDITIFREKKQAFSSTQSFQGDKEKAEKSRADRGKEARKQSFIFPTYFCRTSD